ncbi:hypothetical protein F0L74_09875 [Chitinophaga agrisoli]|uniref:Uncharacterized protein n=1 Tax=Chitinophaga agrisoli TaxID=2607653 RepID=A0A5B2VX37_9BACT|nr:hypothetical protein [Chitinophaga agrisoli]KAA2242827.1 hypothetical protein F0L74_09875 [Chitinophaga agrisoli]
MKTELQGMNARVHQLVDHYAKGNVSKFVRLLNEAGHEVSQQKFNRIFNLDPRSNKYPSVPTDIVKAITETFEAVSHAWLLKGDGAMLIDSTEYVQVNVGDELRIIRETNAVILSAVAELLARSTGQAVTVVQKQLEGLVNERLNA